MAGRSKKQRLRSTGFPGLWLCSVFIYAAGCAALDPLHLFSPRDHADTAKNTDNPFTNAASNLQDAPLATVPAALDLLVVHVQAPVQELPRVEEIWKLFREDIGSADDRLRLETNGIRAGVGRVEWWDDVRNGLEAIEGKQAATIGPLRLPLNFPLGLELDTEPHDQTLFVVGDDGVVRGATWPQSRNLLRVYAQVDPRRPDEMIIRVTPEIRRELEGYDWIRTDVGLQQRKKAESQAFESASFTATLRDGDYLLVAPSAAGTAEGLLG
ncbi:MAG: hypothetical protein KDA32_12495, partial [Phycisphaerales bacterium]|nr:hypothetical protein [Phycisphaerales bacterium]